MSSRALRKLQQEVEAHDDVGPSDDDDISMAGRPAAGARAKGLNPFDLLNPDSFSESEVKEDDDASFDVSASAVTSHSERKKKSKRKKKKRTGPVLTKSSEDNLEDEVDRSLREVNQLLGEASIIVPKPTPEQSSSRSLISVDSKNLNPENELKKIFGARIVMSDQHRSKRAGRTRAHHRSVHWLVVPKPSWPRPGKTGLSMRFIESSDVNKSQYFTFEHSTSYQGLQKRFYDAVDTNNPESIIMLLQDNPYHIDSMLQLAEICKMGEDTQRSAELVERILYAMETAFHPLFNLAVGTCRLDYRRQENRPFFLALFKHLMYVGSRACHRTALEFCKLILSLDPDTDPLAMLLLIDFYALRSQQYSWLIQFVNEWDPKRNLMQLPNMAYSTALAHFYTSKSGNTEKADELLKNAIVEYPGILLPLLDQCSVDNDMRVAASQFLLDAQSKQPKALDLLSNLYVKRAYHVWKEPSILPWLETNVHAVLDMVDAKNPRIAEGAENRKKRFVGTPLNIYRHVFLSDIKEMGAPLPPDLIGKGLMTFDPLPPPDSINAYEVTRNTSKSSTLADPSYVNMFFRSMMPNFNPENDAGAAGNDAGYRDPLSNSLNTALESLQGLLARLHLPEVPHDSAESEDADDENWQ